jgi:PPK2 family polyphosphate:nucleotide phosphotransferase
MPAEPLRLKPGSKCRLADLDTRAVSDQFNKESAAARIGKNSTVIAELARKLYAENRRSILDGVNPQSCQVVSFKTPSGDELDHDFLWRVHREVPRRGNIGIFNRSHYEDVLIVRVHGLVSEEVWSKRYDQINAFEQLLAESGTELIKCFLHISKDEQRIRLQDRIDNPNDHWKFNPLDLVERKRWDEYQRAYEDAITRCNTHWAPWYIVPADRKWYRNLVVSELLRSRLEALAPDYPPAEIKFEGLVVE